MISDFSDEEFHSETDLVDDWELLIENEVENPVAVVGGIKDIKSVRKKYKKKVLKINKDEDDEAEELDTDSLAIRMKLAEKWSDLKNVSAKNICLLHECKPVTNAEIQRFFEDSAKLLPTSENQSKNFGSFLCAFASTVTRALLHNEDESSARTILDQIFIEPLDREQTEKPSHSSRSSENPSCNGKTSLEEHVEICPRDSKQPAFDNTSPEEFNDDDFM